MELVLLLVLVEDSVDDTVALALLLFVSSMLCVALRLVWLVVYKIVTWTNLR